MKNKIINNFLFSETNINRNSKNMNRLIKEESSSESINDKDIVNPLKLPLGWDNKPIPFWLYKLHGLNETFICEICGNHKYYGRKAYEKHFFEPLHKNGLRVLGISNIEAYKEISSIRMALLLANKLKQ
mmetsp:Transcript_14976/g.23722  ORF Transcript_14976/g.23722 Transcript_14976/m.23722 type:complete len:129 (+) Transcript_14976:264-650(+)